MGMDQDQERQGLSGPGRRFDIHVGGVAGKVLGMALGAVLVVLMVTLSLALLAVLLAAIILFGGYFWWKTRKLRKRMRERRPAERTIEGEVIRGDGHGGGGVYRSDSSAK